MKRLLTSCFGLGWLPIAPGTWGSIPVAAAFALMFYFGVSWIFISIVMALMILAGAVVCVKFAPDIITATGKEDPGEVVADEFAGQAVTFLPAFFLMQNAETFIHISVITTAGFLLFRFFDILKPWPIRKLENLPAGWGILCDDLLAGVYAAVVLTICTRIWIGS